MHPRIALINIIIQWAKIRRENTRTIISSLGTPDDENLQLLLAESDSIFNERLALIPEACALELQFLAEADFPGVSHSEISDLPNEGPMQ